MDPLNWETSPENCVKFVIAALQNRSRIEISVDSSADWEACKQVYHALKEAERRKKEESERLQRTDEIKATGDTSLNSLLSGTPTESKDVSVDQSPKVSAAVSRKPRKSSSQTPNSDGSGSSTGYVGPVTRQRQRLNQSTADSGS